MNKTTKNSKLNQMKKKQHEEAIRAYKKSHYRLFSTALHIGEDDEYISELDKMPNKTQFIREAIIKALKESK